MTDYTKLVKALRICHVVDCDDCVLKKECVESIIKGERPYVLLHNDAADAIEALQAEIRESMQRCAECSDELEQQMPKRGEIVRCGECKYRTELAQTKWHPCVDMAVNDDWFCADGERKEE